MRAICGNPSAHPASDDCRPCLEIEVGESMADDLIRRHTGLGQQAHDRLVATVPQIGFLTESAVRHEKRPSEPRSRSSEG
ncbi:MAG: hypothetical protein QOI36_991, partial [Pseudonocardiales bacterium]|nr:hypothetical protein [Pseudonocardiales bacterium]